MKVRKIRYIGIKRTIRRFSYFILSEIVVDKFMFEIERKIAEPRIRASLRCNRRWSFLICHRSSIHILYNICPIRKNPAPRLKNSTLLWYYKTRSPPSPPNIPTISLLFVWLALVGRINKININSGTTLKYLSYDISSWPARIYAVPVRKNSRWSIMRIVGFVIL